jgi:hypothetical protein
VITSITACPGPNLAYFDKVASLKEMVDHIYGRANILREKNRPHLFVNELKIYTAYIRAKFANADLADVKLMKYFRTFFKNMSDSVDYYKTFADRIFAAGSKGKDVFLRELQSIRQEISVMDKKEYEP